MLQKQFWWSVQSESLQMGFHDPFVFDSCCFLKGRSKRPYPAGDQPVFKNMVVSVSSPPKDLNTLLGFARRLKYIKIPHTTADLS